MNYYESKLYMDDLRDMADSSEYLQQLRGKSILITGATGLICSAIVDLLIVYNEESDVCIDLYIAGRNRSRVENRFKQYSDKQYFHYVAYDATSYNGFDFEVDYIIHGASNAYPGMIQSHPIETMLDNFTGMYNLLVYATRVHTENVLYISSSEVYGNKEKLEPFDENEYGYVDLLKARSSYPVSKRAAETLCVCFSEEKGIKTTIVRPGHIYGPTASENDNRISSTMAYDAANGKDIVLKSKGEQIRSYMYMLDCASAILCVLIKGENKTAYNIANSESVCSIRELAETFSQCAKVKVIFDMPSETEKKAFNPMINSSLKSEKLKGLGWKGRYDIEKGVKHTIEILKG